MRSLVAPAARQISLMRVRRKMSGRRAAPQFISFELLQRDGGDEGETMARRSVLMQVTSEFTSKMARSFAVVGASCGEMPTLRCATFISLSTRQKREQHTQDCMYIFCFNIHVVNMRFFLGNRLDNSASSRRSYNDERRIRARDFDRAGRRCSEQQSRLVERFKRPNL